MRLRKVYALAGGPPVPVPADTSPASVESWCDATREAYQEQGIWPTPTALANLLRSNLPVALGECCAKTIYHLYEHERVAPPSAPDAGEPTFVPHPPARGHAQGRLPGAETASNRPRTPAAAPGAKEGTPGQGGKGRYDLFGHPVTAVIRWMGTQGWTKEQCRKALVAKGLGEVSDTTVQIQLRAGAKGDASRGEPAQLDATQAAELNSIKG